MNCFAESVWKLHWSNPNSLCVLKLKLRTESQKFSFACNMTRGRAVGSVTNDSGDDR